MASVERGAQFRPLLAIWLTTLAITISTWLLAYVQIQAAYSASTESVHQFPYRYVIFASILTSVLVGSAFVISAIVGRLVSSEATMRRLAREMKYLAEIDVLTRLPNRHYLMSLLKARIERLYRYGALSLIYVDIDNFKKINDLLGHNYGDELLKSVARRLSAIAGAANVIARIGGDEFAIVVDSDESQNTAQKIAEEVVKEFKIAFGLRGDSYVVCLSMGIATLHDEATSEFDLLTQADLAMYSAKSARRVDSISAYRHFTMDLSTRAMHEIERQQELQYAIREGEFLFDYQVIVDAATQREAGVEAILKWQHPERGLLTAEEFLPFAERTGFGPQIGAVAMESALRQFSVWRTRGRAPEYLLIKVSLSQLIEGDIASLALRWLRVFDIDPTALHMELAEGEIHGGGELLKTRLKALRAEGIQVIVGAFGARAASLSLLSSQLFAGIKIDRKLVRDARKDRPTLIVFEGIVHVALNLGMSVVVDGVDGVDQLSWLRQYQGISAQGEVVPVITAASLEQDR
ncbi:EAL domain-containing protein [Paraburkholderia silviterrae]|uniref:EAL domain-containing protein n=2 Tax=Paraburkholderia silviterrae TaxID=2528715 RepID=A0A4R5M6I2_9BURK|nr:EAL domain-containing protein [Paraburkholderia silviterrae]